MRRAIAALSARILPVAARGRRDMLAGLLDAGLASLATFVVGIYAVRFLDPASLGGYALCYQAIFLVGIVPANLIFAPAEVAAIAYPPPRRIDQLRRSLALGAPAALAAALAVGLWVLVAPTELDRGTVRALTVTAIATAFFSPLQDHVRRILHSAGVSWTAVLVSTLQLLTVVAALAAFEATGVAAAWIPFGALGLANFVSAAVGLAAAGVARRNASREGFQATELLAYGRWLTVGGLVNPAAGFAAAAVVSRLAGAEALGYAEGARVVAQPVWVLAVGLTAVLGPRSMEAARARHREEARAVSRTFVAAVVLTGAACMALVGTPWRWNPIAWLLPTAYAVEGLVLLMLLAQTVTGVLFPYRSELLGARRSAAILESEIVAGAIRVAVAATAGATGAYAIPLAFLASALTRLGAYARHLRRHYFDVSSAGGAPPT